MAKTVYLKSIYSSREELVNDMANAMLISKYCNIASCYEAVYNGYIGLINFGPVKEHIARTQVGWFHFRNPLTRADLEGFFAEAKELLKNRGLSHDCKLNSVWIRR